MMEFLGAEQTEMELTNERVDVSNLYTKLEDMHKMLRSVAATEGLRRWNP